MVAPWVQERSIPAAATAGAARGRVGGRLDPAGQTKGLRFLHERSCRRVFAFAMFFRGQGLGFTFVLEDGERNVLRTLRKCRPRVQVRVELPLPRATMAVLNQNPALSENSAAVSPPRELTKPAL